MLEEAADAGGSDAEGPGCPGEDRVSRSSGNPVDEVHTYGYLLFSW